MGAFAPAVLDGLLRFAGSAAIAALGSADAHELLGRRSHGAIHGGPADRRWREREARLAEEQAALRRVAALVAEGAKPADVFAAVAREVAGVLKLPAAGIYRYEPDGTAAMVGAGGAPAFGPGTEWPLGGTSLPSLVRRTGRPARIDDDANVAGVGVPIVVDGELWGIVAAGADQRELLPPDAERRLGRFTSLVAAAISNSQAREDLRRLADEQATLRRLATLVARAPDPQVVFDAVCEETGRLVGACSVTLARSVPDGIDRVMARWSERGGAPGAPAGVARRLGIRSSAHAPVVVEGRVWGALIAAMAGPDRLPAGTEHVLASFAELIATSVSNAAARSELVASRVRIVAAADEQRRRVVRDLHDGAQERLVHAIIALQRAHDRDDVPPHVRSLVEQGVTHVRSAVRELRELAHGIHPEILTRHGLAAAIQPLADRAPLPVEIEIPDERYPTPVESAAYFVTAEALANVAKYAHASTARITGARTPAGLSLVVEDDGVGGAQRTPGRGLAGLGDRLAALDGVLTVDSPPGGGTRIQAEIPLRAAGLALPEPRVLRSQTPARPDSAARRFAGHCAPVPREPHPSFDGGAAHPKTKEVMDTWD